MPLDEILLTCTVCNAKHTRMVDLSSDMMINQFRVNCNRCGATIRLQATPKSRALSDDE